MTSEASDLADSSMICRGRAASAANPELARLSPAQPPPGIAHTAQSAPLPANDEVAPAYFGGTWDGALTAAIEAVDFGILVVEKDGWILFGNRMARDLIRCGDGLRSSHGWLAASTPTGTAGLRALISVQSTSSNGAEPKSGILALGRGKKRQPLFVQVVPLRARRIFDSSCTMPGAAFIFILDPVRYAAPHFHAFVARYRLTPAESRLLREIVGGGGLTAAAAKLGVSVPTARTHLQKIFGKTGTGRQTELLCLFYRASLPDAA
jgi:DNA-binding CsgD family transcriptional regulator